MNNGGPAFPVRSAAEWQAHGMNLRDYFAAKALQGIRASREWSIQPSSKVVRLAYEDADAMLAARDEQEKQA